MSLIRLSLFMLAFPAYLLGQTVYCPQKNNYISTGMSEAQVLTACGQPTTKQEAGSSISEKIPTKQLLYTNMNQVNVRVGPINIQNQWSLNGGSSGINLQVDIVNNKISTILLNGSNTNAATICGGIPLAVGMDENQVYNACGSPTIVNNSYVEQTIPSAKKPQVWLYQVDQFQPGMRLTFIDGTLQSIN
ncbi:MAG: DUF2845 domain-containing protein [Legionella sp.]